MSMEDIRKLIAAVAHANGVLQRSVRYGGRSRSLMRARAVTYWLLHRVAKLSYPEVGQVMGKDHSTVLHVTRSVDRELRAGEGPYLDALLLTIERLAA